MFIVLSQPCKSKDISKWVNISFMEWKRARSWKGEWTSRWSKGRLSLESEKEESIPEEGGRKEEMTGVKDVEGVEEGGEEEKIEESGRRLMSEGRNSQRKSIESDDRWD